MTINSNPKTTKPADGGGMMDKAGCAHVWIYVKEFTPTTASGVALVCKKCGAKQ